MTKVGTQMDADSPENTRLSSGYPDELERATRGLLELNVAVLDQMNKTVGLTPLRALQALERRGPSQVTALGNDLDMLVSTVSRLSDRLTNAGLITRRVSPTNRRATLLELTDAGREILKNLINTRTAALETVIAQMNPDDRASLLAGTRAFTAAWRDLPAQSSAEASSSEYPHQ